MPRRLAESHIPPWLPTPWTLLNAVAALATQEPRGSPVTAPGAQSRGAGDLGRRHESGAYHRGGRLERMTLDVYGHVMPADQVATGSSLTLLVPDGLRQR